MSQRHRQGLGHLRNGQEICHFPNHIVNGQRLKLKLLSKRRAYSYWLGMPATESKHRSRRPEVLGRLLYTGKGEREIQGVVFSNQSVTEECGILFFHPASNLIPLSLFILYVCICVCVYFKG